MSYRERCYASYAKQMRTRFSLSKEEYELLSKGYKKRFADILPPDKRATIIDVACGAGQFLYFLKKQGYTNVKGIDLNGESLECAKRMGVTDALKADIFKYLPGQKAAFDVIIANQVIEHFTKDEALTFLDALHASLKDNGIVILGTPNAASLFGSMYVNIDFTHETAYTPASLAQAMLVAGFEEIRVLGEGPLAFDLKSFVRAALWQGVKGLMKSYMAIAHGTGRGLRPGQGLILEPAFFAVGKKRGLA